MGSTSSAYHDWTLGSGLNWTGLALQQYLDNNITQEEPWLLNGDYMLGIEKKSD